MRPRLSSTRRRRCGHVDHGWHRYATSLWLPVMRMKLTGPDCGISHEMGTIPSCQRAGASVREVRPRTGPLLRAPNHASLESGI
jgi:hypothetical protein